VTWAGTRGVKGVWPLLLLCACALLASGCRSTNNTGKHGLHKLKLRSTSGEFRVEGEAWDENRVNQQTRRDRTEKGLREELMVRLLGFYYDPLLLDYDLRVRMGLEQIDIDSTTDDTRLSIDGDNLSIEGRAFLFKEKPYSAELYSSRQETRTRQLLFETTEAVITEVGVNLDAKEWSIPSRLSFSTYEYDGRGLDRYGEKRDTVSLEGRRRDEGSFVQYTLERNDVVLELGQAYTDTSLVGSTMHTLSEDGEPESRLQTSLQWREQTGAIDNENRGASVSYHHGWAENLSADHDLQYGLASTAGASSESFNLSSGLNHQLFSSLSSGVIGRAGRFSFDQGNIDTVGGAVQINYRKETPIGNLSLRHVTDGYLQDQGDLQGKVPIVDEPHLYEFGVPIYLENTAVDHLTVVVTDDQGLVLYTRGLDYTLVRDDVRTRLDIPVGSLIVEGQTILVDYLYAPIPSQRFRSVSQSTRLGLRVPGILDFDLGYGEVDQTLLAGLDDGTLTDILRRTAGLRFFPWGTTVGAEYEDYDSEFTPYERVSYFGSVVRPVGDSGSLNLTLGRFDTRFKDDLQRESGTTVGAALMSSIGQRTTSELRAAYREIDYRTDKGAGYQLELGVKHRFQALTLSLRVRYSDEEFEVADDQRLGSVLITLVRSF
jgi:hypothetical protein